MSAIIKPRAVHTAYGQSIQVRYPYDLRGHKVYEIHTSPQEFTRLILPPDERLAAKLALDPAAWEVSYGKTGAEGSRQELIAVRPLQAPQRGRDMVLFQSGLTLYLQFVAAERPGMLSVAWEMPPRRTTPPEPPLEQRPPKFDASNAYAGYVLETDKTATLTPPWLPEAVVDDGRNTLIKFRSALQGTRMPVVTGVQQTGKPALVQSRLYVREEHGAWLYVQGLWPALHLKDAQGLRVTLVRQVPPSVMAEVSHVH
jgi:type IV secretory pathway VirB9-like protein